MLSDNQLLRYSRQIMLPKIDIEGQQKLLDSHVVILGLGGLGSPVAMYLASAGIGELTLIDDDLVELSNLQRQIIHQDSNVGQTKVASAKVALQKINSDCVINIIDERLKESQLNEIISNKTIVVDCCDNFETRFMLNRICFTHKVPLVSGAAIRWEGQLSTFLMTADLPCYRCLYEEDSFTDQTCSQNGVVAPLVGIIGSMQAMEAIKVIVDAGIPVAGQLKLFDGLDMEWRTIKFKKRDDCPVCS
jgi:molybdopterin-synthase adenylyltransferase